jgi:hypothetical protein
MGRVGAASSSGPFPPALHLQPALAPDALHQLAPHRPTLRTHQAVWILSRLVSGAFLHLRHHWQQVDQRGQSQRGKILKLTTIKHVFVEYRPEKLEEGVVYVSIDFRTAVHNCCCGCGNLIVTPLSPVKWKLGFDGVSISLSPSIGNWVSLVNLIIGSAKIV